MNLGAVEVIEESVEKSNNQALKNELKDNSDTFTLSANANRYRELNILMKNAIDISNEYFIEKKSMFSSKRKVSKDDFLSSINNIAKIERKAEILIENSSQISSYKAKIARNQILYDQLRDWQIFDYKLNELYTKYTKIWLGTVENQVEFDELKELIAEDAPESFLYILKENTDYFQIVVIIWEEREERVAQILKSSKFMPLNLPVHEGTPKEIHDKAHQEILDSNEKIRTIENTCAEISKEISQFEIIYDHSTIMMEKTLSSENIRNTEYTFVLNGWAPSHLVDEIENALNKEFCIAFKHRKTNSEDNYPILLKNHPLIRPYEVITTMFSTPSSRDIDPNPLMAPFFIFFFSMMLSDAGYGLMLAAGCGLLLWKFKVTGGLRSMCLFIFQGGLASVVWGLLFGGFFGNILTVLSTGRIAFPTLWFNPMEDPTKLMIWSMLFGVIHILAGLGAKAFILIITGRVKDAIFDILPWCFIIIGAIVLIAGMLMEYTIAGQIGKYMCFLGLGVVVLFGGREIKNPIVRFFKGLAGLYDITSYFSDILSYTRIVALSLATGVIAMVVNMLGSIAGFGIGGIIVFVLVGVFGHLLNLALSTLGCYVHTSRLQYVEFFSKFYEGGGRAWNPLSIKTKYIQID